jgi:competence protein ComEA
VPFALSRSTVLVVVGVSFVALVLVGHRFARVGTASKPEVAAAPLEPETTTPARALLVVDVVGEVRRPGLYKLRDGARIADAVRRAGGASRKADLAALNLAAPLVDGIQILVPGRAPPAAASAAGGTDGGPGAGGAGAPTLPVSLSSATVEELDQLPGVGPVTAQKIVDYRTAHGPFASVDDLDAVPGIGPTRIEQLRDLVTP